MPGDDVLVEAFGRPTGAPRPQVRVVTLVTCGDRRIQAAEGLEVDALHAMSMVGLAVARRSDRRAALAQACVALGFAAAGAAAIRGAAGSRPAQRESGRIRLLRARDEWARTLAGHAVPERLTAAVTK